MYIFMNGSYILSVSFVKQYLHMTLTLSGGIDEQFSWHRNQEQNISALGLSSAVTLN